MSSFRKAFNVAIAELTPQPWDYTTPGGTTLTIIPEGLTQAPGGAEVIVRVTMSHAQAAEIGITTTAMPELLDTLTECTGWEHISVTDDVLTVDPLYDGSVALTVVQVHYEASRRTESTATVHVPESQRLPLVSALRRATDVAHGWERDAN